MARTVERDSCPGWDRPCNNLKRVTSQLCIVCSGQKNAAAIGQQAEKKRIAEMLERHRAIKAGKIPNPWTKELGHPPGIAPIVHEWWESSQNL